MVLTDGDFAMLNQKIDNLKEKIDDLHIRIDNFDKKLEALDNRYVSIDRFRPVEMIAYAIISLFGGGLVMAISALIIKK